MITVKVKGVDAVIREFDRKIEGMEQALDEGCEDAADYLIEKMEDKFGHYQSGWAQLKEDTIWKETKMGYGSNASKPLVMTADMMFAFDKILSRRTRKHVVWITNNDPKISWHMDGVPSRGIPARDPVRPTLKAENDNALQKIRDAVKRVFKS